jgi:metal-sulfur cluster biosynthetic enzyme
MPSRTERSHDPPAMDRSTRVAGSRILTSPPIATFHVAVVFAPPWDTTGMTPTGCANKGQSARRRRLAWPCQLVHEVAVEETVVGLSERFSVEQQNSIPSVSPTLADEGASS